MGKKKRKRGKRSGPPPPPRSSRPPGPEAGREASVEGAPLSEPERRQRAVGRREERARRRRLQYVGIAVALVLVVGGFFAFQRIRSGQAVAEYEALSTEAAGCASVESVGGLGRDHTQSPVEYESSPPAGGDHHPSPLRAGIYQEPFSTDPGARGGSIFQAVHSLEHGYVIVWHDPDLDPDALSSLERLLRRERKTILVPYPELEGSTAMALTAWGRLQRCEEADPEVVGEFIELFREKTAPEANAG